MYDFGVGQLILVPPGANPTPLQLGTLQEVTEDTKFTDKDLYGSYQLPVDVARAQAKLTLKAKFASINGQLFNLFLTGATQAAGYSAASINEASVIPATPFTVTVLNSATWTFDNGVRDLTSGKQMTRVAAAPTTGQYSVAAGAYLFAAADTGHAVWISYVYTVAGSGFTTSFTNQLMGSSTAFVARLFTPYGVNLMGATYYAVKLPGLSIPFKNEDFTILDLEMNCYADATGRVVDRYTSE
jgi:hypothetical protein